MRWLGTEPAQNDAIDCKEPEEHLEDRTVISGTHLGGVEPWQEQHDRDRTEHRDDAEQFVRNSTENGVEGQEVPFRHDMRRCRQRVGLNVVVRVAQIVRHKANDRKEDRHNHGQREQVFDDIVRPERNGIRLNLGFRGAAHFDTGRVVVARGVEGPDVHTNQASDDEGQQVMQAEEAVERRVIHAHAAPEQFNDVAAHHREGAEQIGDDGGTPEGHLAPGQHIAHEGRCHHQQEDHHAQHPQQFAWRLVGTVIHAAEDVDIDHNKEHAGAVHVNITDQPAEIHITHDAFDTVEGQACMRGVIHGQENSRRDHDQQRDHGERAEIPEIVEIFRRWEGSVFLLHHRENGHALVYPAHHRVLEFAIVQPD